MNAEFEEDPAASARVAALLGAEVLGVFISKPVAVPPPPVL